MKNLMAAVCAMGLSALAGVANGQVVMSQVYGGGGNSGSVFTNDFVELYNKGAVAVDLTGYTIHQASTTGSTWAKFTIPSGTIQPSGYFLVQLAAGGTPTGALPTPDAAGTSPNFSGTTGKAVLTSANVSLTGTCPTDAAIIDKLGWGATNCPEGTNAAGSTNGTALIRANGGCTDTNNNASDFSVGTPTPRNSASPTNTCPTSTPPSGTGNSTASICPGQSTVVMVEVTQGTNPAAAITGVTMDTTSIGGGPGELMYNDGTNGDVTGGDSTWSANVTVFTSTTGGRPVPIVITDAQSRVGNATATVNVSFCGMSGPLVAEPVCVGGNGLITLAITPAQSPTSTGITATADLSTVGGSATQQLFDDGSNGDATPGDNTFSYLFTAGALAEGSYSITAAAVDAQARTLNRTATMNVGTCANASSTLVISAIYGGGGNAGSTFTHDFVELFNRGAAPVSLDGLSIQYASGENDGSGLGVGTDRMHTLPASVTLQPGQYYLIAEAGTVSTPTPDATGAIAMSATRGTIALVNGTTALGLGSCGSAQILDMVGYGTGAAAADRGYCREGSFHAPTLDNAIGLVRRNGGCWDTNNSGMDFLVYTPAPRFTGTTLNPCGGNPCPGNECGSQDYNGDGDFGTDQDIEAFFACLGGVCCETCFCQGSDFNGDGDFGTDQDIEAFFRVLGGGGC